MSSVKLKSPQEIVDNVGKVKKGDLLFARTPRGMNLITQKGFLIGTVLADVEIYTTEKTRTYGKQSKTTKIVNYFIYLLVMDKFIVLHYKPRLKFTTNLSIKKLEILLVACMEYEKFMTNFKYKFNLKGF